MESGLLSLKWNNHSSTFFHVLETIRKKELYSDVTIACDGKFFSVHKLVLSTCSEYFQEMFERTQCKHPIVVLKDINHSDLESLLNYMYIGEVNVMQTELSSLIKAAECLKVKGLAVADEPPPAQQRKSNKRSSMSDREDPVGGGVSGSPANKRNRRSTPASNPPPQNRLQSSSNSASIPDDRRNNENMNTSSTLNLESNPLESISQDKSSTMENQSPNHTYKEYETIVVKTEKEDSNHGNYVEDELPPVTKYEYDRSPVDDTMNSGLGEDSQTSYSSHLQQQQQKAEEGLGHLIPSTSGFHGESSNWGSDMEGLEGLEEGDKERGEGGSYDPSAFLLDNPQAKAQMASRPFEERRGRKTTEIISELTLRYLTREGPLWRCAYPECSYSEYNKTNIIKHVRKHTGETPFACSYCNYRCCNRSNLNRHLKRHQCQALYP